VTGPEARAGRPNRRPVAVLQHVAYEGPGLLEPVLRSAGLAVSVVRLDRGEPLPSPGALSGLVVLGGPMGVGGEDAHPWLVDERDLLAGAVAAGLPVLGICLGAQQLASALGAEVRPAPAAEVGLGAVVLTPAGRRDPVLGPEYGGLGTTEVPCVHWHADTFSLPEGAVHLAATRAVPHQAFRVGERAYGLQFHVEVDADLATAWAPHLPSGVTLDPGPLAVVTATGRRVLGRFAARVAEAARVTPELARVTPEPGPGGAPRP
jgi:GMP synthase-like glutamine amidotransferase